MKTIYLLLITTFLFISALKSQCTFGNFPPTYTSSPYWTNGIWLSKKFTLATTATLSGMGLNSVANSGSFRMAIYTDATNAPGNLIGATAMGTMTTGYNELSLPSLTVIPAGDYWITAIFNSGNAPLSSVASTVQALYILGGAATPPPSMSSWTNIAYYNLDYWAVINTPSVTIAGPSSLCEGIAVTLTASGASSYSWNTGVTTSTISVAPLIASSYSLKATGVNGCTATAMTSMAVNPLPTITIAGASTLCAGEMITLNASGANTYTWNTSTLSSTLNDNPSASTEYTVIGTAGGCISFATKSITVFGLPSVSIAGNNTVCAGSVITLTANGAASYAWDTGISTQTLSHNSLISHTYTVIGTSINGCTATAAQTVNVVSPALVVSGSNTICNGSVAAFTLSGASTYSWSNGSTTSTLNLSPSASTLYTAYGYDANGCMDSKTVSLTVNPLPVISYSLSNPILCAEETGTITLSGANTFSLNAGSIATAFTIQPLTTTLYTVTGTDLNGCKNTVSITQSVNICTGIQSADAKPLSAVAFPNPSKGIFDLHIINTTKAAEYMIVNLNGNILKRGKSDSAQVQLDLTEYANGFYYVIVKSDDQVFTFKLIKE